MTNFINQNIAKSKTQCQDRETLLQFSKISFKQNVFCTPNQLENNPIIESSESSDGDANLVVSSSCRGDSCYSEIIDEYITQDYSGDGYADNSVLTDDEDFTVPPVVPVINLDQSNNVTTAMSTTTAPPQTAVYSTPVTTLPVTTAEVSVQTTQKTSETSPLNVTTFETPTEENSSNYPVTTPEVLTTSKSISSTTAFLSTTSIKTTTAPKPNIHIWVQGGDGFGDSAKVFTLFHKKTIVIKRYNN